MTREKQRAHADGRPRIHIWPHSHGAAWSIGPAGPLTPQRSPGAALDDAFARTGIDPGKGYVVIGQASL